MPLITLAQADAHLRLDLETDGASPPVYTDARTANVELKMVQAEAVILNYLKLSEFPDPSDSPQVWSASDVSCAQTAVLVILSALFDDADGRTIEDCMKAGGMISLLLIRLRDPALA